MPQFNEDSPEWPAYSRTVENPKLAAVPVERLRELFDNRYYDYQVPSPEAAPGQTKDAPSEYLTVIMVITAAWMVASLAAVLGLAGTNPDAVIPVLRKSTAIAGLAAWFVTAFYLRHRWPVIYQMMGLAGLTAATAVFVYR